MFSANFEFAFGVGAGATTEFSYVLDREESFFSSGDRVDSGLSVTAFLDIGDNFELPNGGVLSSISVLFETGYNHYMRIRTRNKDIPDYKHKFYYHNIIFGVLPKLNFNYGISLGIGAGIFLPLYSETGKRSEKSNNGLSSYFYDEYEKFNFEKISYMYKVPIMPYIKLNVEKYFYFSEKWAFKIGANMIYNFGIEFDMDNLRKNITRYTFDEYKFSSLSFEVFFGFGFGRPK